MIAAHVPWTRLVADMRRTGRQQAPLLELARRDREWLVLKPNDEYGGKGVMLGWEATEADWDAALERALRDAPGTWVVQERIPVRREVFPMFDAHGRVEMRDMLVDLAPYCSAARWPAISRA